MRLLMLAMPLFAVFPSFGANSLHTDLSLNTINHSLVTGGKLGVIGDSLSTAMNADDDCFDAWDCLSNHIREDGDYSFSKGIQPWSIYKRLQAGGYVTGVVSAAENGARWDDALTQAQAVVADPDVTSVVIELGGNDVCRKKGEPMPAIAAIETHIDDTLTYLTDNLPQDGLVIVGETPHVVDLYAVMRSEPNFLFASCQDIWDLNYNNLNPDMVYDVCVELFGSFLCQYSDVINQTEDWIGDLLETVFSELFGDTFPCSKVLHSSSTSEDRAEADAFNVELNTVIRNKAASYNGRNGITVVSVDDVYEHTLTANEISYLDCFHPSRTGQETALADVFWPTIYNALLDSDGDSIMDSSDNCIEVANPDQRDTDGDGYGNICDPDFDNNLFVQAADLAYLKSKFFTADEHADLDGNGVVQAADLAIMKAMFFMPPGPSGLAP